MWRAMAALRFGSTDENMNESAIASFLRDEEF